MLKIKDDVTFEDLKKFGFNYENEDKYNYCRSDKKYPMVGYFDMDEYPDDVFISVKTGEISWDVGIHYEEEDIKDYIQDLIEAGLVEEVKTS
jgi:hypothetical protein